MYVGGETGQPTAIEISSDKNGDKPKELTSQFIFCRGVVATDKASVVIGESINPVLTYGFEETIVCVPQPVIELIPVENDDRPAQTVDNSGEWETDPSDRSVNSMAIALLAVFIAVVIWALRRKK